MKGQEKKTILKMSKNGLCCDYLRMFEVLINVNKTLKVESLGLYKQPQAKQK